jgi:RNA polymerase sigma-B factor
VALKPAEEAEFADRDQDALEIEVLAEVDGLDVPLEEPDDITASEPVVSAASAKASARRAAQGAQHVEKSAQRVSPRPRSTNAPPEGEFERLFAQWRATGDPALRDRLILMHRNLVTYLARRFTDRGEMYEDIIQQGLIGLINALDHFDANRGVRFATFATPTIVGEIRRYFRDKTWSVRVPRRLQELHQTINKRIEALTQELDRSPTYAEIARALGVEEEDVVEAMEMSQALDPTSLDETTGSDENGSAPIADQVGGEDANLERVNEFSQLQDALQQLTPRQQTVLKLAYFEGFSQAEIAKEIKVSPMHVSRLQRRALSQLREVLEDMEELERKRGR